MLLASLLASAVKAESTAVARSHGRPLNFENDVLPILGKFGCNSSGCHGKAEGQNGFKLSVFGFDPKADFGALVMEGRGRRVFPAAPERSLLLRKATGAAPHGGGVRFGEDSPEYQVLRDWVSAGTPFGSADDPQIVRIELTPREQQVKMGQSFQLRVTATWSDGSQEDATRLSQFQSNNDGLATVDEKGRVSIGQTPGAVAVMVTYLGCVDVSQALIPRGESIESYPQIPEHNFIDTHVYRRLRQLDILPSDVCDDATYLRRAYLSLIGTLPTADEARGFLSDDSPNRRARLIDELLERREFADYWALFWSDLLRVDRQVLGHKAAYEYYRWIRESMLINKPLDQFARELLTAEGPLAENPQGNFFKVHADSGSAASAVSQIFLGTRIECAQCHHHPFDRWSQADYAGMQALFAQVKRKGSPWGEVLFAEGDPVTKHPRSGEPITAHPLGEPSPEKSPEGDRRRVLADWLASPENPFFARNIANRVWARMMGRGLVEPVDDVRATNPPSNPQLLDALAQHFIDSGYDLRELIRTIAASRVYQQSPEPNPTNAADEQNFSRAYWKRLDAEVLLDAVCQVTGMPEKFEGVASGGRAIELWDSQVSHYFLKLFGRPVRQSVCECERIVEPSVAQVLHLMNSERVLDKIAHQRGQVARLVRKIEDDGQLVDQLYLSAFSRFPAADERQAAVDYLQSASAGRRAAAEDLTWSLLNSMEFVFNR